MQFGNLAFRNRVDAHACEEQSLVDGRYIGLIARETIQTLG